MCQHTYSSILHQTDLLRNNKLVQYSFEMCAVSPQHPHSTPLLHDIPSCGHEEGLSTQGKKGWDGMHKQSAATTATVAAAAAAAASRRPAPTPHTTLLAPRLLPATGVHQPNLSICCRRRTAAIAAIAAIAAAASRRRLLLLLLQVLLLLLLPQPGVVLHPQCHPGCQGGRGKHSSNNQLWQYRHTVMQYSG